jgi:hypothetical protein
VKDFLRGIPQSFHKIAGMVPQCRPLPVSTKCFTIQLFSTIDVAVGITRDTDTVVK